jgi:hypothetical protein
MNAGERRARAERGRAEYWVLLLTAVVLGFAFLWGLVLHEKPPRNRSASSTDATVTVATGPTASTVPVSLPQPRKYKTIQTVNMRQGPATNTAVLGQLPAKGVIVVECRITGESVTSSHGNSDQWLRILTPSGSAYISALYADVGDDLENPHRIGVCPGK